MKLQTPAERRQMLLNRETRLAREGLLDGMMYYKKYYGGKWYTKEDKETVAPLPKRPRGRPPKVKQPIKMKQPIRRFTTISGPQVIIREPKEVSKPVSTTPKKYKIKIGGK